VQRGTLRGFPLKKASLPGKKSRKTVWLRSLGDQTAFGQPSTARKTGRTKKRRFLEGDERRGKKKKKGRKKWGLDQGQR